jgi:hypothetical protein
LWILFQYPQKNPWCWNPFCVGNTNTGWFFFESLKTPNIGFLSLWLKCHLSWVLASSFLMPSSSSSGAQCVILQIKIGWIKVKHAVLAQQNCLGCEHFGTVCWGW